MNALTAIAGVGRDGQPVRMNSLEIAELVEARHDNAKRTIERLAADGVISLPPLEDVKIQRERRTETTKAYVFEGDQGERDSIVVVARLSPEFTARLVDQWRAMKEALRSRMIALPQDYASALRALADESEKTQALGAQIEADAPKVAFAEQVEVAPDAISLGQAAKVFDTGRTRFCAWLRQIRWVNRMNEPYQDKIEAGLLDVKISPWEHPEKGLQRSVTALVTGKGMTKLHKLRRAELTAPGGGAHV